MRSRMIKRLAAPLLVLAGLTGLGGCDVANSHMEEWSTVKEPHAPTARRILYSHDVLFSKAATTLNESEARRLKQFLASAIEDPSINVFIVPGSHAAGQARGRSVSGFLAAQNISVSTTPDQFAAGEPPSGAISVVVSRYVVALPPCPDWTGERFTYDNLPTSNWGCANAVNLGRMVARPEDLVRGRDPGAFDAEFGSLSINKYRKGQTKPLTTESVGPIESQQPTSSGSSGGGAE